MRKNKKIMRISFCILILLILSINILRISYAGQTSNTVYFLSVGEEYYQSKSNELIPQEAPAIWRIKTNFDNECFYIFFDISDTTNPEEMDRDKLIFCLDIGYNNGLTFEKSFKFEITRDFTKAYYRYDENISDFVKVDYSNVESFVSIDIQQPNWKISCAFNYSHLGFLDFDKIENQSIGLVANYWDHVIGSQYWDYMYPIEGDLLQRTTYATGCFIKGFEDNTQRNNLVWVLVIVIIGLGLLGTYYASRLEFFSRPKNKSDSKINQLEYIEQQKRNEEDSRHQEEGSALGSYEPW